MAVSTCRDCDYSVNGDTWHCLGAPVSPLIVGRVADEQSEDRIGHYTVTAPVIDPDRPACMVPHMMEKLQAILDAIPGPPFAMTEVVP